MRFIFIDRILDLEKAKRATMLKSISASEDYFTDHFPGFPVVPGALVIEALEEASILLIAVSFDFSRLSTLKGVHNAKFRRLVRPGEQMVLTVEIESLNDAEAEIVGKAQVNDEPVARLHLVFSLVEVTESNGLKRLSEKMKDLYHMLRSIEVKRVGGV